MSKVCKFRHVCIQFIAKIVELRSDTSFLCCVYCVLQWVPEITYHCPKTPFLLVGLETDLREDAATTERLSRLNQAPVSVAEAERLAHELGAVKYIECSDVLNSGVKEVFYEAVIATIKPVKPVKKQGWFSTVTSLFQSELNDIVFYFIHA